jgi:ribosome modulation factor
MAVDRGYGSGAAKRSKRRPLSGAERARAKGLREGTIGRRSDASPFNDIKGRAIGWDELASLAAAAGFSIAGTGMVRTRSSNPSPSRSSYGYFGKPIKQPKRGR